jgi:hypothetical protein
MAVRRPVRPNDCRHIGVTQEGSRFHQRIEHDLKIERRAADDLENAGCRRLVLARLMQFVHQALHLPLQVDVRWIAFRHRPTA